ncbi:hypothetical protein GCK72_024244 [Caenorhabditis remanei]|uniref:Uncharacterized protein n=1 Tax=Caenorhabditis remanei TaxID=31234 RepID=A0A6A5FYQ6_CAERE|nr:hypothetical protein GCK72_024244 [Caenorhabditis remanei]KAF1747778.1 hypothetical protein GCK72_024244 [Caenorhabditis remanei]
MKLHITLVIFFMMTNSVQCLHRDSYAEFEANASMFPTNSDGLPPSTPLETKQENRSYNNYRIGLDVAGPKEDTHKTVRIPITARSSPGKVYYDEFDNETSQKNKYAIFIIGFIVFMLILFVILSNINSSSFRLATTEKHRHIDMVVDTGLESIVVLDIPNNEINTSRAFFIPGFRNQLSVVREDSQEIDF